MKGLRKFFFGTNETATQKTNTQKTNTQTAAVSLYSRQELNVYNRVTDNSNLTHQNVHSLMRLAFIRSGITQAEYERLSINGQVDICVIGDGGSSLCDTIVKFIGQDPKKDRASFAICRGLRDSSGRIYGNTHWTALHLRRSTDGEGKDHIHSYYSDSMSDTIPPEVAKFLNSDQINLNVSRETHISEVGQRGLQQLPQIVFEQTKIVECDRQIDGNSCGYHAVYNLLRMHSAPPAETDIEPQAIIIQKEYDGIRRKEKVQEFIGLRREELKQLFNPAMALASKTKGGNKSVLDNVDNFADQQIQLIFEVIDKNELQAFSDKYYKKIYKLVEINQHIIAKRDSLVYDQCVVLNDMIEGSIAKLRSDYIFERRSILSYRKQNVTEAEDNVFKILEGSKVRKGLMNLDATGVLGFLEVVLRDDKSKEFGLGIAQSLGLTADETKSQEGKSEESSAVRSPKVLELKRLAAEFIEISDLLEGIDADRESINAKFQNYDFSTKHDLLKNAENKAAIGFLVKNNKKKNDRGEELTTAPGYGLIDEMRKIIETKDSDLNQDICSSAIDKLGTLLFLAGNVGLGVNDTQLVHAGLIADLESVTVAKKTIKDISEIADGKRFELQRAESDDSSVEAVIKIDGQLYKAIEGEALKRIESLKVFFDADEFIVKTQKDLELLSSKIYPRKLISDDEELKSVIEKLKHDQDLDNKDKSKMLMIHGAFFSIPFADKNHIVIYNNKMKLGKSEWIDLLQFIVDGRIAEVQNQDLKLALETCNLKMLERIVGLYPQNSRGNHTSIVEEFFQGSQHDWYKEASGVTIGRDTTVKFSDKKAIIDGEKYCLCEGDGGGHYFGLVFGKIEVDGKLKVYVQDSTEANTERLVYLNRIRKIYSQEEILEGQIEIVKTCVQNTEKDFFKGLRNQCRYTAIVFSEMVLQDSSKRLGQGIRYVQDDFEDKFARWFDSNDRVFRKEARTNYDAADNSLLTDDSSHFSEVINDGHDSDGDLPSQSGSAITVRANSVKSSTELEDFGPASRGPIGNPPLSVVRDAVVVEDEKSRNNSRSQSPLILNEEEEGLEVLGKGAVEMRQNRTFSEQNTKNQFYLEREDAEEVFDGSQSPPQVEIVLNPRENEDSRESVAAKELEDEILRTTKTQILKDRIAEIVPSVARVVKFPETMAEANISEVIASTAKLKSLTESTEKAGSTKLKDSKFDGALLRINGQLAKAGKKSNKAIWADLSTADKNAVLDKYDKHNEENGGEKIKALARKSLVSYRIVRNGKAEKLPTISEQDSERLEDVMNFARDKMKEADIYEINKQKEQLRRGKHGSFIRKGSVEVRAEVIKEELTNSVQVTSCTWLMRSKEIDPTSRQPSRTSSGDGSSHDL